MHEPIAPSDDSGAAQCSKKPYSFCDGDELRITFGDKNGKKKKKRSTKKRSTHANLHANLHPVWLAAR